MEFYAAARRLVANCTAIWRIMRTYPATLLWPLFVLGLVLGLGTWGVARIGQVEENSAKSRASSLALDTSIWFNQQLSVAIAPVQLMAAIVQYNPQYNIVQSVFAGLAPVLLEQDPLRTIKQLEYVPNGVIADIYPLEGNNGAAAGVDLFNSIGREDALKTVKDQTLTLVGPLNFFEGGRGVIVREPIFVSGVGPNETFGIPHSINPYCGAPCGYDATNRTKFWGFAAGLIDLRKLSNAKDSKLRVLEEMGYRYEVLAQGIADPSESLVATSPEPICRPPVEAPITLPNTKWVVRVCPAGGWRPSNFGGLLAGVVVVALALALLLFAALVSRKRNQMLLEALLPRHVIKDLHGTDASRLGQRILQAETPADLILNILARLLEGHMPDLRDVVFIRQAIIRGADLYQPLDLRKHIRSANLDNEVARALMQQLGNVTLATSTYDSSTHVCGGDSDYPPLRVAAGSLTFKGLNPSQPQQQLQAQAQQDCSTLAGALAFILASQPAVLATAPAAAAAAVRRLEPVDPSLGEAIGSEAMLLPMRETEVGSIASPRVSTYNSMVRAVSQLREGGGGGGGGGSAGPTAAGTMPSMPSMPAAAGGGISVAAGSCRLGASMELVQEEDEQLYRFQRQQRHHHQHHLQRQTPGGSARRSSLTFREPLQRISHDDVVTEVELPPPPLPRSDLDVAAAAIAGAAGTPGASGGGGGESDGRLTPNSATSVTQEDNTLNMGTFSVVRRLPRRVASAMNILGRPGSARQRRSSLIMAASGNAQTDVALERRLGLIVSAAAVPSTAAAAAAAAAMARRASVASVASVPEALVSGCQQSDGLGGFSRGSGTGMEVGGNRVLFTLGGVGPGVGGHGRRSHLGCGPGRAAVLLRASSLPPPPPVIEEVERFLSDAGASWKFDTWRLRDVTNGHPLSALGFYLMHRAGLIAHFNLNPVRVARLLRQIEAGYNDNPYHNATHAADVLQTLHVIIHGAQLHVHYLDRLGLLAAYFAAIVHDYGHPGLTNDFLVATSDPLAVRYNDKSPLENHHAAAAFGLLQRPELDVLTPLSKSERAAFRKQVIEMVLATDMKQHFSLLSQFSTAHRLGGFSQETTSGGPSEMASGKSCPSNRPVGHANSEPSEFVVDMDACGVLSERSAPKPIDDTERLLTLQLAIKAADLGHLGEELEVHQRWLSSLEEEFFSQGDKERQLGIPISPLFDRAKQGVSKSQVGFYDFVALPLVHALCTAFPGMRTLMRCFLANYNHWRSVEGQAPVAMPAPRASVGGSQGFAATGAAAAAASMSPPETIAPGH